MLFNSIQFLIFLPIVFLLYWFVFKNIRWQNAFVVASSYFFYGMWDWRFLILIFITSLTSYYSGIYIYSHEEIRKKRIVLTANLVLNLGILCVFKYFNFFSENIRILFEQFGFQLDWFTIEVLLPVGISFYTFQAISYPIDVYCRRINAISDLVAFLAFVSFFPQLVAGPIERSNNLLVQFLRPRHFDYAFAVEGMRRILWGFFKKIVIADNCAFLANTIFSNPQDFNGSMLLLGAVFFTFQIYGDFSGYSDIAIGTARLFGVNLMQNFHYPYLSRTLSEFWKRWHISLNKWFVEYVYIPLGGSRCSKTKMIRNTMVVFLLSGLWHGASWTFVLWGAYHGVLLVSYKMIGVKSSPTPVLGYGRKFPSINELVNTFLTFAFVLVGWIIFRSETVGDALAYIYGIFRGGQMSYSGLSLGILYYTSLSIIALMVIEYIQRQRVYALDLSAVKSKTLRWSIYLFIMMFIVVFCGTREPFIYFQF